MLTDRLRCDPHPSGKGLSQTILLIAVDAAHAHLLRDKLADAHDWLPADGQTILMPVGDAPVPIDTLEPNNALAGAGLEFRKSTHGTALDEAVMHLLPQGRLFVVENGRLCLRPREAAQYLQPLVHLTASLARQYGRDLTVLLLTDAPQPDVTALLNETGGRLLTVADLSDQVRPESRRAPRAVDERPSSGLPAPRGAHMAHDLRQPLQTLTLLQNLLARQVKEPKTRDIVERLGETIQQLVGLLSQPPGLSEPAPALPAHPDMALPLKQPEILRDPDSAEGTRQPVYVIDDDRSIREAIRSVLEEDGLLVQDFDRCEAFLEAYDRDSQGCLLVDAYLPGMSGLDLLAHLKSEGVSLPSIVITGSSDVQMAVRAMKIGATDFIEKPVGAEALLAGVRQALDIARDSEVENVNREKAAQALKGLTRRQKQIMAMVLDGQPSKNIAADLCISQRTVENHRAAIMKKTGSRSLPALARLVLSLSPSGN